jgi:hypothetical protein
MGSGINNANKYMGATDWFSMSLQVQLNMCYK